MLHVTPAPYTLQSAQVEEMRKKFDDRPFKSLRLSFDDILGRLLADDQVATIARGSGVKRSRLQQIYNAFFKPLFGDKPGIALRVEQGARKRLAADQTADASTLGMLITQAQAQDLAARRIRKSSGPLASQLLIGSHACKVMTASKPKIVTQAGGSRQQYVRFTLTRKSLDTVAFVLFRYATAGEERLYIVPSSALLETAYANGGNEKQLYLLLNQRRYASRAGAFDFSPYLNAWDLLKAT